MYVRKTKTLHLWHYLQIKYAITTFKLEENGLPMTESLKVTEELNGNLAIGGDVVKEVK